MGFQMGKFIMFLYHSLIRGAALNRQNDVSFFCATIYICGRDYVEEVVFPTLNE